MHLLKTVEILQIRAAALHRLCPVLHGGCARKPTEAYECLLHAGGRGRGCDADAYAHVDGCLRMLTFVDASHPPGVDTVRRAPGRESRQRRAFAGTTAFGIGGGSVASARACVWARSPKPGARKAKKSQGGGWLLPGRPWLFLAFAAGKSQEKPTKAKESQGLRAARRGGTGAGRHRAVMAVVRCGGRGLQKARQASRREFCRSSPPGDRPRRPASASEGPLFTCSRKS